MTNDDEMKVALGEIAQRIEAIGLGLEPLPTTIVFAYLVPCQNKEHQGDHDDYGRRFEGASREKVAELLTFLEQDIDGGLNIIDFDLDQEDD